MPGLFGGFGNYFVVIFQGSPEVVYPRVNNFSILILSLSYLFLILSLISEFGGGTGWTLYPPLSTSFMSLSPSSTGNLIFVLVCELLLRLGMEGYLWEVFSLLILFYSFRTFSYLFSSSFWISIFPNLLLINAQVNKTSSRWSMTYNTWNSLRNTREPFHLISNFTNPWQEIFFL